MRKEPSFIAVGIVFLFFGFLIIFTSNTYAEFENGKKINLKIADSPTERAEGLMNREFLGENEGMLFVYSGESNLSFWMKDTLISLDIIFLDKDYKVVSMKTMQPCSTKPCQTYSSEYLSQYAIEVNAGFIEENNISVGQIVRIK